jgi:hypothetical protein
LRVGQTVHDFIESAIAAAGDYQLALFDYGLARDLYGVTGSGGFREFGFDSVARENAAGFIDQFSSSIAAVSGIRVVDQQRVLEVCIHALPHISQTTIVYVNAAGLMNAGPVFLSLAARRRLLAPGGAPAIHPNRAVLIPKATFYIM